MSLESFIGALGATETALGVAKAAWDLLERVRRERAGEREVDEDLLRLALLAVDHDLVVLGGVNTRVAKEHRDRLFGVAEALEVAPLAALLIQWPEPGEGPKAAAWAGERRYEDLVEEIGRGSEREQLLAHARYVVARTTGLRELGRLDPAVRRKLRVGLRLRNIRDALVRLRVLLVSDDALAHLVKPRGAG